MPAGVHHPIVPSERMRGTSDCGAYGDFIQDLDLSLGRIVDALDYEGIGEDTIVIFTSDNGGDIPNAELNWPETQALDAGLKANGMFRGDKHTIWEGGTRVPLIVRWHGNIAANTVNDRMVNIVDLYSTLSELVSGKVAAPADAPDSVSFAPALLGKPMDVRPPMITSNEIGLHAICDGQWKYIDGTFPKGVDDKTKSNFKEEATPALYDLKADPAESKNVIKENPEVAERLRRALQQLRGKPTRS
ncbi:MAG: sulfatase-like hydrolase/transferase [Bdellovibrionaceae bacterium]|nr:sulfatase-like hydrolase/transferase [Pseudobdellovibrionaceae bacterium]